MPSFDFIRDLLEKIQSQGFEYLFLAVETDKENNELKVSNYQYLSESTAPALAAALDEIKSQLVAPAKTAKKPAKKKKGE